MKLTPFQLILLIIAGASIIIAVLIFAFSSNDNSSSNVTVTMWGTMKQQVFNNMVSKLQDQGVNLNNVVYTEKDPSTIEKDYVKALAEGSGPDIIMLSQDQIVQNENRVMTIPFESYPLRTYTDTFIDESDLYVVKDGILAVPFTIDPLVMYWNKTLFVKEGISSPPTFWDEVMQITPRLTVKDSAFNLEQSAVAMGEFQNISHAKEIFLTLIMQAGNDVVVRNKGDSANQVKFDVILNERLGYTVPPTHAALNFYTQFANPAKEIYSWNRSLPFSQDRFIAGDLAMYFGFASELNLIQQKNPNLSFDVSLIPQSRSGQNRRTFGKMNALAISKNTPNVQAAFEVVNQLSGKTAQQTLIGITNLPPVRRDLLNSDPGDPYQSVFYTSALWADGILDINPVESGAILQRLIELFITGRLDVSDAVSRATNELLLLLNE